ncbi:thioredoxin family protein [Crocinitomicaceae bacterium]|nr:thioredoxin family protein [Crocinitomicaceae bacterium]
MIKFISLAAFLLTAILFSKLNSQIYDVNEIVKAKFSVSQDNCDANILVDLIIADNWHINTCKPLPDANFYASEIDIPKSTNYSIGGYSETATKKQYLEEINETFYLHHHKASLKRKIFVKSKEDFKLKGDFVFQACMDSEDGSGLCLSPEFVPFELLVKKCGPEIKLKVDNPNVIIEEKVDTNKTIDSSMQLNAIDNSINKTKPTNTDSKVLMETPIQKEKKSLWLIFILSFLSGLAALLTPCVFPMIPMTVSFFTKQSQSKAAGIKNAIIYGISIILIYIILGTVVSAVFGPTFLNQIATGFWANILFFILIMVFAISFLGAFEITLPTSWINKSDKASDRAGIIGIFFMAFTLALVSFSCTGPIVGALLVQSATVGGMAPFVGMFGFSLALALPFSLFAAFPGWLNSLPQSGGWLNTVKVFLGFLELALAFKFLSMADTAIGGHYIERELFLAINIGILLALAMYLFGYIRLPHDSKVEYLSVGRTILGTFTLVFVIYLLPGLWGAPLKLISGYEPPKHNYSESPLGFHPINTVKPANAELGPHGLFLFHDMKEGLKYAKESNKPVLLDFTGINCQNCRRMENKVWGEQGVIEILREKLVIISLETDDRETMLPKKDQKFVIDYNGSKKQLKTKGDKYSHIQTIRYQNNSQPYYRLVIPGDGENFTDIDVGSADFINHGTAKKFQKWLESGLNAYKKIK